MRTTEREVKSDVAPREKLHKESDRIQGVKIFAGKRELIDES